MITIPGIEVSTHIYESANTLVYRGIRTQDKKPVILKVLNKKYPTPEELARYKQEFEIISSLNIFGVINAYTLVKYQRTLVIILEDFGGESLRSFIQTRKLTLAEFILIGIQSVDSLARIHSANIIHKDINPSNIVYNSENGELKLIDFGISTVFYQKSFITKNVDTLEGTPAYTSPELTGRMNRSFDYRADFYSLGVTFYELLTSQLPFETTDLMELVHCHIAKQPVPPHEVNPEIPLVISNLVMKLLAKNADDRYQSAWGIKADLEESLFQLVTNGKISNLPIACQDVSQKFQIIQKLYHREREIETLLTAFGRVSDRNHDTPPRSEMMLISGYSGVGKSALVQEFYKLLTQQQGYFISGKFDEFSRNIPYSGLIQAFQQLIKQLLTESESQINLWRKKLLEAFGSNGQMLIDVIPEVELIVGKQSSLPVLSSTEFQNRFHLIFKHFIQVFTQPEHPLVIFIDDLQWVDNASMQLIQLLMTAENSQYLFLIGAYRDNEVDGKHLLKLTLDKIQKSGTIVNYLHLEPLDLQNVNQLIVDTFNCSFDKGKCLAELLVRKTNGNPFFVNQFLQSLYQERLVDFDLSPVTYERRWRWNLEQIQARDFTDNVVELMVSKIQKLSSDTQEVLKLAACIGHQFDIQTIANISEKLPEEILKSLCEPIEEGFILLLKDAYKSIDPDSLQETDSVKGEYKFAHDRIQQAAYFLIPQEHRSAVHQKVGQLLLKNTPQDKRERKNFDIVNQLNLSIELINHQSYRDELASLNLMAAKRAKGSVAYEPALRYLQIAMDLLAENSWDKQYDLTLALYVEATDAAYLNTNFEEMERLAEVVLCNAKTLLDTIKIYEVKIQAYMAQNQPLQALEIVLPVVKSLGVNFPDKLSQSNIWIGLLKTKISLVGHRIEDLIDLPTMTNSYKMAAIDLLSQVRVAAYLTSPPLYSLIVFEEINLLIKYGNTFDSAFVYAAYGMILCGVVGDIDSGYRFGQLAMKTLDKFNMTRKKNRAMHVINSFIKNWKEHGNRTLEPLIEAYKRGKENGDFEFCGYSAFMYSFNAYCVGENLRKLEQQICSYSQTMNQLKQQTIFNYLQILHRTISQLMDESEDKCSCQFLGEFYNEEKMLPLHLEANDKTAICNIYFHKMILCYLFHNYHEAVKNAEIAQKYLGSATASLLVPLFYLYDSLARLAVFKDVAESKQKFLLKQVTNNQKKMKKWADHAPMNYLHKFYLVEAERDRVLGKNREAREYYDRAIALAHEHEYINEEALAYELAAKFYIDRNQDHLARHYLQDAHYAYQLWGATAKVKDLEAEYPQFLSQAHKTDLKTTLSTSTTGQNISYVLDLLSVLKGTQTISGEIILHNLLAKLMKIVIENAGAQKGFLILHSQTKSLNEEDNWVIEATGSADSDEVTILQSIPINSVNTHNLHPFLSTAIINYVARTRENVVLNDALHEGQFTRDRYILTAQSKSILCTPLLYKAKLSGILYLENNLTTGAFTPERVEVLRILSAQAAISIENSRLYEQLEDHSRTLEQKVKQRTQQLQQKNQELANLLQKLKATQSQIIAQEKLASLGALTAGIAHEIKNPLNFVNNFAELSVELTQELLEEISSQKDRLDPESRENIEEILNDLKQNAKKINEHGTRADNIVRGMLMHSRGQTGDRQLTDINALLAEAISLTYHGMRAKNPSFNMNIETEYDDKLGKLNVVPQSMSRAFINIIHNACYAACKKKKRLYVDVEHEAEGFSPILFVRTKDLGEEVEIHIRDNGEGIPQKALDKIFNPFFTTKPPGEGTGLGLSITHDIIVQQHQGNIRVETEMGSYTKFIITLPKVVP
ncbi:serine/threonine protein kinase [Brasilonema octagenarum UFV-E1]|uniref:histidine kinase n=1 Tax=Brasilonema sennae CENA114 TaxID=415709 RepID=A0A856MKN9_9CYAN|nr:AAA family ATPase [Brasilonema sennae]QDL09747.1 serine/threonine protein kinase [Brasilonema sennae CENA114]QDL16101.1 serine/threonine protein kinase [Brasilonema octagenarum UFV-E1]